MTIFRAFFLLFFHHLSSVCTTVISLLHISSSAPLLYFFNLCLLISIFPSSLFSFLSLWPRLILSSSSFPFIFLPLFVFHFQFTFLSFLLLFLSFSPVWCFPYMINLLIFSPCLTSSLFLCSLPFPFALFSRVFPFPSSFRHFFFVFFQMS